MSAETNNFVFCGRDDEAALWAWRELKRRGRGIELMTADALAFALRFEHRLGAGGIDTEMTLADGRLFRARDAGAVFNRLHSLPDAHLRAAAADRDYALTELFALFASWLAALPGIVWNAATPAGLCGSTWMPQARWIVLAAQSGFDVEPYVESDVAMPMPAPRRLDSLLVIGDTVLGAVTTKLHASALQLAQHAGLGIAGIRIDAERGTFHDATPLPDLRIGGSAAIDALEAALQ